MDKELNYIKNSSIRESGRVLVSLLPEYFFEVPASSSGKYHPDFSLGEGGLLRHTKAAVRIAKELLDLDMYNNSFDDDTKDLIILALMLHDGLKSGREKSEHTLATHPMEMSNYIAENADKLSLDDNQVLMLRQLIESHMGQWNRDRRSNREIMPLPTSKAQKFVHQCDYIASRKFLDVKFDDSNEIISG